VRRGDLALSQSLVFSPAPPPLPASAVAVMPAPGPQFASFVPRRRDFVEPVLPTSTTAAAPPSPIQMQRYYPGGPRYYTGQPPCLPSTAMSSPFVGPTNPFIRSQHLQADRESVVSSPSHHPLPLSPRHKKPKKNGAPTGPPAAHGVAPTTAPTVIQRGPRESPARVTSNVPPSSNTD